MDDEMFYRVVYKGFVLAKFRYATDARKFASDNTPWKAEYYGANEWLTLKGRK